MTQAVLTGSTKPGERLHWPKWGYIAIVILVALAAAAGLWYFSTRNSDSTTTNGSSSTNSSQSGTNAGSSNVSTNGAQNGPGSQQSQTYKVLVYFSKHSDSDNNPAATFPVHRTSPDLGVAKFAVAQLLAGPTASEAKQGFFTTVRLRESTSNCGGDFTLSMSGGTAKLRFCKPFDHLGVVADGQAESEIQATLKQFPAIQKVIILNSSGNCEFNLSGLNLCLQ